MSKPSIYKPRAISGFPEWLPETRALELSWLDHIRRVFESYGFVNIETPAVEEIDVLLSKGETDKEIYALNRLQSDERDNSDSRLALHFDLTVPFARYTAQHFNALSFPFKRYQIQKVWRGERPQEGRFREFYQCDIDIINPDHLPMHFDAEIPAVIDEILQGLNIPAYTIYINNRKVLLGYMQALGLSDNAAMALRILDKRDKIGPDGVRKELVETLGLDPEIAERALQLALIKGRDASVIAQARALGVQNELFSEGLDELEYVLESLGAIAGERIVVDMSIVRGFDYYTGTVYEAKLDDYPAYGTVASGGRYEDLAGQYINRKLPGIGVSLGLTRLLDKLIREGAIQTKRASKTDLLVTVLEDDQRKDALALAAQMRKRGLNVEVYHTTQKLKNQLAYASKKQIPYVWFLPSPDNPVHQVKDMDTGQQQDALPDTWTV